MLNTEETEEEQSRNNKKPRMHLPSLLLRRSEPSINPYSAKNLTSISFLSPAKSLVFGMKLFLTVYVYLDIYPFTNQ